VEFNPNGTNQNVWTFVDSGWLASGHDLSALALTSVQFKPSSGYIQGVDVEINSEYFQFTLGADSNKLHGASDAYDLLAVVQHESGHYFGLAHSNVLGSTMAESYAVDGSMRTLSTDDAQGICAIYPAERGVSHCNSEPPGGFSTECWVKPEGCCAIAPGHESSRSYASLVVALLGTICFLRRRLRGRGQPSPNRDSRAC
jgi:hypothetical protein